jgi:hemolysin type calcium-binding protein
MKAKICTFVVTMLAAAPLELSAKTLGMVADDATAAVTVFDADTHAVLGTVSITPGSAIGDVLITPDLKWGFVTNSNSQVWVIDLTTLPPSLAGGTNPIPISNFGDDLSISPDGKFLIVADGTPFTQPISVINIAAQAEVSTFFRAADPLSVDVCSDGSVLVTSFIPALERATVRRLNLSAGGTLTDTGEKLSVGNGPTNVYCAPGAASGVAIRQFPVGGVTSFTIPGLAEIDNRSLSGLDSGISGAINPSGNRVFARSNDPGFVDVFGFNSATGALEMSPLLTIPVADHRQFAYAGIEQIALHPNGGKLFVSEIAEIGMGLTSAVNVYDSTTGALLASIRDPSVVTPTGVTVMTQADPCAGSPPAGAIVGTNGSDSVNGTSGNDTIFGLGGSDIINGRGGNDLICGGAGSDLVNGGPGNDTIDAGSGSDTANGDADNDNIKGGTGSDLITGGVGDDMLDVQDGVNGNDSANGGAHVSGDTCTADPGDAVSNCSP